MGTSDDGLSQKISNAAKAKVGSKAVDGGKEKGGIDCFALVDEVLKSHGAKSAADFGTVTPTADYVWGVEVKLKDIQPGDILQFRDHSVTVRTQTLGEFKWETTSEQGPSKRPHHTAIVVEVRNDGSVVVVEQNVKPKPDRVTQNVIPWLEEGEETKRDSIKERRIITVKGTAKAYRPVPKTKSGSLFRPAEKPATSGRRVLANFIPADGGPKRQPGPIGMGSV